MGQTHRDGQTAGGGKRWGGEAQPDRQYNSVSYLVGALSPVNHRGLHQGSQIDGTTVVVR